MPFSFATHRTRFVRMLPLSVCVAVLLSLLAATASSAAVSTFGSPLSVPATLNTAENLELPRHLHAGPAQPRRAERRLPHVPLRRRHGAVELLAAPPASRACRRPARRSKVEVEGCAQRALERPAAAHDSPLPGPHAAARRRREGQHHLAGLRPPRLRRKRRGRRRPSRPSSRSTCASAQATTSRFNDSGGYVPNVYRSGVPYQVLGAVDRLDDGLVHQGPGHGQRRDDLAGR